MPTLTLWERLSRRPSTRECTSCAGQVLDACVRRAQNLTHEASLWALSLPDTYVKMIYVGVTDEPPQRCEFPVVPNDDEPLHDVCCRLIALEAGLLRVEMLDHNAFSLDRVIGTCKLRSRPAPLHWCPLIQSRGPGRQTVTGAIELFINAADAPAMPPLPLLPPRSAESISVVSFADVGVTALLVIVVVIIALIAFSGLARRTFAESSNFARVIDPPSMDGGAPSMPRPLSEVQLVRLSEASDQERTSWAANNVPSLLVGSKQAATAHDVRSNWRRARQLITNVRLDDFARRLDF